MSCFACCLIELYSSPIPTLSLCPGLLPFLHSIFLDPKYGTFVFHTAEGQSKCPNEKGTRPVEEPSLTVSRSHGPGPIIPDDTLMTFTVELSNTGYGGSTFYLYHDISTNPGEKNVFSITDQKTVESYV